MNLNKYKKTHLVLNAYYLLYNNDVKFIGDLIKDIHFNNDEKIVKDMTCDILRFSIDNNSIFLKNNFENKDLKIYKDNSEMLKLISDKWKLFSDFKKYDYYYGIELCPTISWKKELVKIGLWDRSIL